MELVNPAAKPRVRTSPLESQSASLVVGNCIYKLTFASKISMACGRQHNSVFGKIGKYIPGFSASPGFILQKQNEPVLSFADETGTKRFKQSSMGASSVSKSSVSQFVPLTVGMAGALFDPKYVDSLKSFIMDEEESGAGTMGDVFEERSAEKPACRFPPPLWPSKQKSNLGTLIVGTTLSNYNIVRNLISEDDFQFEGDEGGPQLLCQITMVDSKAEPNVPPLVHFSVPSSHMICILECEEFRNMIDFRNRRPDEAQKPMDV